jgi:hypothetical protein
MSALQAQSPEFKPQPHQENQKAKTKPAKLKLPHPASLLPGITEN